MKVALWKILNFPKYRWNLLKRRVISILDWEVNEWAVSAYADACDFISTYRTIEIRMKYERWPR